MLFHAAALLFQPLEQEIKHVAVARCIMENPNMLCTVSNMKPQH